MRRWARAEEHAGELNIVPYLDVVTNLVVFMLLSITGLVTLGVVNVSAPKIGGDTQAVQEANAPRLLLTVAISKGGFYVAGAGGVLGGAADKPTVDSTSPPTVPLKDGKYDFAGLTDVLAKVKERYPQETNVILSADPDIQYEVLVKTMDAAREYKVKLPSGAVEKRPLFYDVSLSLIS
ncbi:MAG TPA: biopolymer transporter ExbD [Anaeromyxobacteraceae bacterium]|nr:biopolymer transporter ExbD [Anaeromyxobacteraceae bacterium]